MLERAAPGRDRVINAGFSGRHSGEGLDRMGEAVIPHLPGILLMQWGINDCYVHAWQLINRVSLDEFRRNMTEMVRIARSRGALPVIIIGHYIVDHGIFVQGNGLTQPENFAPYELAMRSLVSSLAVESIDLPAEVSQRGITPADFVCPDGVHLSALGHKVYADIVHTALGRIRL